MTTLSPAQKRRFAQKKFIDECMATQGTLADVLTQSGLTTRQLAAWLRDKSFRRRLHRLQDLLRTARQLDIDLLARQAVDAIRPDAGDPKDARRAALDILKLARASEARQRTTSRKEKVLPALTHPEVDSDTARELIAQLDR
jgi:transcriptional regulator with XRE-family HTH domain